MTSYTNKCFKIYIYNIYIYLKKMKSKIGKGINNGSTRVLYSI